LNGKAGNTLAKRRILVAEDESLIALELEEMLQGFGCEVVGPFAAVEEVLEHAEAGGLDGALLDVNLRGEQIFRILPQLLASRLPIIITSGYNDSTLFRGDFRHLPQIAKPFDEAALREICERVFGVGQAATA